MVEYIVFTKKEFETLDLRRMYLVYTVSTGILDYIQGNVLFMIAMKYPSRINIFLSRDEAPMIETQISGDIFLSVQEALLCAFSTRHCRQFVWYDGIGYEYMRTASFITELANSNFLDSYRVGYNDFLRQVVLRLT